MKQFILKSTLVAALLCISSLLSFGQFNANFGTMVNTGVDFTPKITIVDNVGNIYVAGTQESGSERYPEVYKYSPSGTQLWNKTFTAYDIGTVVTIETFSGEDSLIFVCTGSGMNAKVVIKLDDNGNEGNSFIVDIRSLADATIEENGDIYISGTYQEGGSGYSKPILYKLSPSGDEIWSVDRPTVSGNGAEIILNNDESEILWTGWWSLDGDIILFLRKISTSDGSILVDDNFNQGELIQGPTTMGIALDDVGNAYWARFEGRSEPMKPSDKYYSLWSYDTEENATSEAFWGSPVWNYVAVSAMTADNDGDIYVGSGIDEDFSSTIERLGVWSVDLHTNGGVSEIINSTNYLGYFGWNGDNSSFIGVSEPNTGEIIDTLSLFADTYTNICFDSNENYILATQNTNGIMTVRSYSISYCPSPVTLVSEDQTLCSSTEVTLNIETNTTSSFTWDDGVSTIHSNSGTSSSVAVTPTGTRTYNVEVDDGNCTFNEQITVTVNPTPLLELTVENDGGCSEPTLQATEGFYHYNWVYEGFLDIAGTYVNSYAITDNSLEGYWAVTVLTLDGTCEFTSNDVLVEMLRDDDADYYWVGGSGSWTDANHWSSTSGGAADIGCVPNNTNDVYFDANSFNADDQEVELDETATCHSMNWLGIDQAVLLSSAQSQTVDVYEDLILSESLTSNVNFYMHSGYTGNILSPNNASLENASITINGGVNGVNSSFILQSTLDVGELNVLSGDFDSNNSSINVVSDLSFGSGMASNDIDLSGSTIATGGFTAVSANSFTATNSQLTVSNGTFGSANLSFNNVILEGDVRFTSGATIETLQIADSSEVIFKVGQYYYLTNFVVIGQADKIITIRCSHSTSYCTIDMPSDAVVNGEYLEIRGIHAEGGGDYYAVSSTDLGYNTGWIFGGLSQTITFDSFANVAYEYPSFQLSATASSSLPVNFTSSDLTVATISGSTVTIIGAGTTTITASQEGNETYDAAPDVTDDLTVYKAEQTITFAFLMPVLVTDPPFMLAGTATPSNLAVSYTSSNEAVATISGTTVMIQGVGTTTITASQGGNSNYSMAMPVQQTLTVELETSINNNNETPITMFPNPANHNITIGVSAPTDIEIINVNGQIIKQHQNIIGNTTISIDQLGTGIYFVKFCSTKQTKIKKLIIQ